VRIRCFFAKDFFGFTPFDYQEKILRDNSKRIVACAGRQIGKTTITAIKAIHFAFTQPKRTILIVSPSLRQSIIMFDRILDFVNSNPLIKSQVARKTRTLIHFRHCSRIIALPCGPGGKTLRGHACDMIILDEANFVPDEVLASVVIPMISTTDGYLIMLSTPWTRDSYFYKAFTNPNYSTYKFPSAINPLIKSDFLAEQKAMMSELEFRREYEAEFVDEAGAFLPVALLRACCEDYEWLNDIPVERQEGEFYAGLDLGKKEDYSVLIVLAREEGGLRLKFMREFELNTPYAYIIGYVKALNQQMPLRRLLIDQTGVGEPVVEDFKSTATVAAEGVTLTAQSKAEIANYLKLQLERKQIILPFGAREQKSLERRLITQLNEQQYSFTKAGQIQFSHPQGSHDDMFWALALAVYSSKEPVDTSKPILISRR
jgi:phage FluMu gp28-like protein